MACWRAAAILRELMPEADIEVTASEATGDERDRLFNTQAENMPMFAEYAQKTDRVIPVIILTPKG